MKSAFIFMMAAAILGGAIGIAALAEKNRGDQSNLVAHDDHKQLWHCGMHPQIVRDHPGDCPICHMALTPIDSRSAGDESGEIQIDPLVVQNMGVRTAQVTRGTLTKTVRTVGLLALPEPGLHDVTLKVGGWIDKLYADQEGMHIQKGQPLFEVYSPDLQVAEQELIGAVKSQAALPTDANESLRTEAQNLIDSAKRKLRLWDLDQQEIDAIAKADQPPRDVIFRSPATGDLEEKMIVQGASFGPGMKLLRVADHTKMWLDAQVYAQQLPLVKAGQKVLAMVEGIGGKTFTGEISFVYPHLDAMSRTVRVRAAFDNPDLELKPGMYATVQIMTEPIEDAIHCPREAVIDTGTKQIAFIAEGEGHFSPRNVRVGLTGDDDLVQILDGLAPGETVVTSGQFLMDVESRTIEATQKLADAAPAAPAPQTKPAESLTQIYCPMVKAGWIQIGDTVANPYTGQEMSDCGQVRQKLPAPAPESPLADFVKSYLQVQKSLNQDKLDAGALSALKSATGKLPPEKFAALRDAAGKLTSANDLKTERAAFKDVSNQLISALKPPGK